MKRRQVDPEPLPLDVPAELIGPAYAEDWCDPWESPPSWSADREWSLLLAARRRQRDARAEWATERGLDWRELSSVFRVGGRPRFRDRRSFVGGWLE